MILASWLGLVQQRLRNARSVQRPPRSGAMHRRAGLGHRATCSLARVPGQIEALDERTLLSAVVWTDQDDYAFGATAEINAGGFEVGETVQFLVLHAEGTPGSNGDPQNEPWIVVDGGEGDLDGIADGNIHTQWAVDDPDALGATYILTAVGLSSGETATATFTDSGINNFSLFDLTPDTATAGTAKVPMLGFEFSVGASGGFDNFDKIEVAWVGTSGALQRDVSRLFLDFR